MGSSRPARKLTGGMAVQNASGDGGLAPGRRIGPVETATLASIREDLGAGFPELQGVVGAHAVMLAAPVLTARSLGDRLGRRRVFAAGVARSEMCVLLSTCTDGAWL